jgi:hypothetical protein
MPEANRTDELSGDDALDQVAAGTRGEEPSVIKTQSRK